MMGEYKVGDLSRLFKSADDGAQGDNIFAKKSKEAKSEHVTGTKKQKKKMSNINQTKADDSVDVKKVKKKKMFGAALRKKTPKPTKTGSLEKHSADSHSDGQKKKQKSKQLKTEEVDDSNSGSIKSTKNKDAQSGNSSGFCPPAGIVHESLMQKPQKRKLNSDETLSGDSDEEHIPPGKKKKTGKNNKQKSTGHMTSNRVGVEKDDDSNDDSPVKSDENNTLSKPSRMRRDRLAKSSINRTVFVGNLSLDITNKKLTKMFKQFGKIETARLRCLPVGNTKMPKKVIAIKKDFHPKRTNCVGFVRFEAEDAAKKSLSLNGKEFKGLHIRVDMAGQSKQADVKNCVFVGNLPFNVEEEVIWKHFDDCGDVVGVRVIRDKATCIGKGFGYVTFQNKDAVGFALKLNGSQLCGREIRVMNCSNEGLAKKRSQQKNDSDSTPKRVKEKKHKRNKTPSDSSKFSGEKATSEKKKNSGKKLSKSSGKVKIHFNTTDKFNKPDRIKDSIQSLIDSGKKRQAANSTAHVRFDDGNEESFPRSGSNKHIKFD